MLGDFNQDKVVKTEESEVTLSTQSSQKQDLQTFKFCPKCSIVKTRECAFHRALNVDVGVGIEDVQRFIDEQKRLFNNIAVGWPCSKCECVNLISNSHCVGCHGPRYTIDLSREGGKDTPAILRVCLTAPVSLPLPFLRQSSGRSLFSASTNSSAGKSFGSSQDSVELEELFIPEAEIKCERCKKKHSSGRSLCDRCVCKNCKKLPRHGVTQLCGRCLRGGDDRDTKNCCIVF